MDESLVRELLTQIRGFTHTIHERFRRELPEGVTVPHMLLMKALITEGPMTQGRITDALGLSKGGVSQAVSHLEGHGWVERRRDPDDARVQWVHLTPAADRLREQMEGRMTSVFADLFQDWSDDDAQRLIGLMGEMMERAKQR